MSSDHCFSPSSPSSSSSAATSQSSTSSSPSTSPASSPKSSTSSVTMSSSSTQVQSTVRSSASKRAQVIFNHIKLSSVRDGPFAIKPNKTHATNFPINMEISTSNNDDNSCESTTLVIRTGSSRDTSIKHDKADQVSTVKRIESME